MAKTEAQSEREKKKDTFNQRHRRNAQNIGKISQREIQRAENATNNQTGLQRVIARLMDKNEELGRIRREAERERDF